MDENQDAAQVTKNADSIVWKRPNQPGKCFVRLLVTSH
jgi:hypothetical protein